MPGRGQTLWNGLSMDPIKNEIKLNTQELNAGWTASQKFYIRIIKPALDFFFATIGLIILSPLFLVISIAIKIDSRGPVFFKQERVGKDCKVFNIIKFRSMTLSTDNKGIPLKDKDRITAIGNILRKTSMDEIPQIINIMRGKMSFIGPRPLLVRYMPYYTERENKRHLILPGITGLAQVNGRNLLNWDDRLEIDIEYVENISFERDLKILVLTVLKIIKFEDVIVRDENTMLDFDLERLKSD
jgi:undecaprenyl phosphate N,N'-diacetylbacillosamine 1-phosphate transferase